jgi:hypothetical protein
MYKRQDLFPIFYVKYCAFYGLDTEPDPDPEQECVKNRNRNLLKFGTGIGTVEK